MARRLGIVTSNVKRWVRHHNREQHEKERLKTTVSAIELEQQTEDTYNRRILIVYDHRVMRQGLIGIIFNQPGIEVASGEEAIESARQLRPDLILMDISMPGMNGIDATPLIKAEMPEVNVIGL